MKAPGSDNGLMTACGALRFALVLTVTVALALGHRPERPGAF
ncbi:hypothetical protein O3Q52_25260 [Streptomyces sp. ActVer]|nr:hypothetical protein [Streptomyces sp. ActVer]MCZ4511436.1 hypothetical protein [Streptomyces sp. ActVer]